MSEPPTGTREEWRRARVELLELEKEHTRRADELARMRSAWGSRELKQFASSARRTSVRRAEVRGAGRSGVRGRRSR